MQVITQEEAETLQQQGEWLLSETACGYFYGISKAAVLAVQYQGKVTDCRSHAHASWLVHLHHDSRSISLAMKTAANSSH